MVQKINYEISHIKSKTFESYKRPIPILLVLQGIYVTEIPSDLFCYRSCVAFPKKYNESDEAFRKILGILSNIEPTQLV